MGNLIRIICLSTLALLLAACTFGGGGGLTGEYPRNLATRITPLKAGTHYAVTDAKQQVFTGSVSLQADNIYVVDTSLAQIKIEFYAAHGTGMVVGLLMPAAKTPEYFVAVPLANDGFEIFNIRQAAQALKADIPFAVQASSGNLPMLNPADNAAFLGKLLDEPYRGKLVRAYTIRPAAHVVQAK